ncbi:hypothetical protein M5K25_009142 [Dendrobium thyrsiflorum]|uniref:Uncharacterized protein n=1 Tax=Dendrobium thyrsiflorum TaxID=117978 RepID=A0ABD0VBK6_DENTH
MHDNINAMPLAFLSFLTSYEKIVPKLPNELSSISTGLFLPAVVRPILDSFDSAEQVPPPPLSEVVAGVTGKKQRD